MTYLRLILLIVAIALPAWGQAPGGFSHDRLTVVTVDGRSYAFDVELALSADQQTQGLMFRRVLAADAGMLFDFHRVRPVSMWMKNTLLPLDMIFIADDGTVAGIAERTIPQSLDIISSPGPVRAVLEVNGGTASRLGIKAGDRVRHSLFAPPG